MQKNDTNSQTIIFDFDGTIANSLNLVIEIFRSLVPGHDDASDDQIEALRSLSVRHIANALGVPMWKIPLLVRRGRKVMHSRLDEVAVFDGLQEVLAQLHDQGYQMHVLSSNSTENVQTFLQRHDMGDYFISVTGGVGLFGKKRAIRKLCRKYEIPTSRVWYVGDEVRDVVAAKKAGVRVASVGWGFNHPDALRDMEPDALAMAPRDLLGIFSATEE